MPPISQSFLDQFEVLFQQAVQAKSAGDLARTVQFYERALELSLGELSRFGAQASQTQGPPAVEGGEYASCHWIEEHVELSDADSIHYCCYNYRAEDGTNKGHVKIADLTGDTFPLESLAADRTRIRQAIGEGREEVCLKCPHLTTKVWPARRYPIFSMTINSWTECNLRCEYCFTLNIEKHRKVAYDLFGVMFDILRRGLLDPGGLVVWGGGDVSALPDFEGISKMLSHYGVAQQIKTSGIKYSPATELVLKSGKGFVEISLDSGTRETFQAVKGRDMFDTVVANIRRYAKVGHLTLKYIVLEKNHSRADMEGFLALCREVGIRFVTVTPEWDSLFDRTVSDEALRQAAWLIYSLRKEGIKVNPGSKQEVDELFHWASDRILSELNDLASRDGLHATRILRDSSQGGISADIKQHLMLLASYPKSGNTWMRYLLYAYAKHLSPMPEWVGQNNFIPDLNTENKFLQQDLFFDKLNLAGNDRSYLIKTHSPFPGQNGFVVDGERCHTRRFIYIYRNPLDVFLSYVNYLFSVELTIPGSVDQSGIEYVRQYFSVCDGDMPRGLDELAGDRLDAAFERFVADGLTFRLIEGGYFENLESYFSNLNDDSLILRYEDMCDDPIASLRKALVCLRYPLDEDLLNAAIGGAEKLTAHDGKFFNKRRAFYYREYLSPRVIEGFIAKYRPLIEKYNIRLD